ncbi:MAG: AbrB/MazE/SpoVT family DNA-binding domain-containing protein [Nitrososphaerales archaeon]
MLTSRLSSKGQVTIPKEIREAIGLESGNMIAYEVHNGSVIISRVEAFDTAFHEALSKTLEEWESSEDEEAFRDL